MSPLYLNRRYLSLIGLVMVEDVGLVGINHESFIFLANQSVVAPLEIPFLSNILFSD